MRIFLDTSDIGIIRQYCETGLIDGVTTNPTLMMQAGRDPIEVIKEISSLFQEDASISAEVVGHTAEEMVLHAKDYQDINANITIKAPCSIEGLKACKILSDKGIPVNVTLIFSVEQAILSAKAGATYVSPFIGRCEDNDINGIGLIRSIRKVYKINNITTNILAASIRKTRHIGGSFRAGADVVTLPPSVFQEMYKHNLTDQGLAQFDEDWKKVNHR